MPRYNQPRKTWRYTEEFKTKAVQLSQLKGVQVKEVAQLKQENDLLKKWQRFLAEAHQNDINSSRETGNSK